MISVHFQGKSFVITVIQVYAATSNAEEVDFKWFYELTPKRWESRLECKSRKSRDTWSNREVWPWSTE